MNKAFNILLILVLASLSYGQYDPSILYWEPDQVFSGDTVNIYYNLENGALPNTVNPVQLHMGHNGWTGAVNQYTMTELDNGWWVYHHDIPEDATVIDFVFRNVAGTLWDNNGSNDYHIPVAEPGLWMPLNPGPNDTIRIAKAYTGPGNLWWGVNSWSAPIAGYQPPNTVIGEAGLSVETDLLGPDGEGKYWIELGPFNKVEQVVTQLDFVFHWDDETWDNNNGSDYHLPINFEPGADDPRVEITNIEDLDVLAENQQVVVHTENAEYLEILLDGATKHIAAGGDVDITINTSDLSLGEHQLLAFARRDNQRVMMDVKRVWKAPALTYAALPAGDQLGVNDHGDGTVTFALLAPGKSFVLLGGDFIGWEDSVGLMNLDSAKDIFWLNLPVPDGSHEYLYKINGETVVGDPFATDVNWTDDQGNEHWEAYNQKSIVHVGQPEFQWTDDGFVKPDLKDLIIYELLIRDFTAAGNIQAVIDKLDYLKNLGINAIELLPPTEFPGASSWGYNPAFFLALESTYGDPDDMKQLVNEAHKRGIAVLVDLVFNHADGSSPYEQMYGPDYTNSPFMHAESNAWGFPDFDHGKRGTQELTRRTVRYWISEYHVDGYRYDHTPGIGWQGTAEFGVSYFSNEAYQEDNETYQVAEHFWSDVWSLISSTAIQSHWHDAFHDQMKANLRQGQFEGSSYGDMSKTDRGINFAADGFENLEACVNYLESHDEQRVIWEVQTNGLDYEQALQKARLAADVLFTSAGVPMFYMGAEMGMDTERTIDRNPIRWFYLDVPELADLHQRYRDLIWLRKNYAAFRSENINVVYKSNTRRVYIHQRTADGEPGALVAINFDTRDQTVDLTFPWAGSWHEYFSGELLNVAGTSYENYTIPASSAKIFLDEKRWLVTQEDRAGLPEDYAFHPAFPNPFNPSTTLRFDLPELTSATVTIYNLRGEVVRSFDLGELHAGHHQILWDGFSNDVHQSPTGLYLVELRTPSFSQVQKITLMR